MKENKHFICRPCAEKNKDNIILGMSKRNKETCEICNRRRYVYECTYRDSAHKAKKKYVILFHSPTENHKRFIVNGSYIAQGEVYHSVSETIDKAKRYTSRKRAEKAAQKLSQGKYVNLSSNFEIIEVDDNRRKSNYV